MALFYEIVMAYVEVIGASLLRLIMLELLMLLRFTSIDLPAYLSLELSKKEIALLCLAVAPRVTSALRSSFWRLRAT